MAAAAKRVFTPYWQAASAMPQAAWVSQCRWGRRRHGEELIIVQHGSYMLQEKTIVKCFQRNMAGTCFQHDEFLAAGGEIAARRIEGQLPVQAGICVEVEAFLVFDRREAGAADVVQGRAGLAAAHKRAQSV